MAGLPARPSRPAGLSLAASARPSQHQRICDPQVVAQKGPAKAKSRVMGIAPRELGFIPPCGPLACVGDKA